MELKDFTTEELKAELKRRVELTKEEEADIVNDNVRSKLPPNLEDAAISICADILEGETIIVDGYECVVLSAAEECFKAGAEWMASQGENHEATVLENYDGALIPEIYLDKFKKGDKVIVNIRNK